MLRHAVSSKVEGTVKVRKFKKKFENSNSTLASLLVNPGRPPAPRAALPLPQVRRAPVPRGRRRRAGAAADAPSALIGVAK